MNGGRSSNSWIPKRYLAMGTLKFKVHNNIGNDGKIMTVLSFSSDVRTTSTFTPDAYSISLNLFSRSITVLSYRSMRSTVRL